MNPDTRRRFFLYLAYMDDSGIRAKNTSFQVLSAVLIEDKLYQILEVQFADCIERLLPEDRLDQFKEFHATELFNGCKQFEGIDQEKRFAAITRLLELVADHQLPIFYCAVDQKRLQDSPYGSASPVDVCFRTCVKGIEEWANTHCEHEQTILLIADQGDQKVMASFKNSFRQMRKHLRPPEWETGLVNFHDDMYFGDSKDSIGIQLADSCSYFIAKYLEKDVAAEGFYNVIKDRIIYAKMQPE